METRIDLDLATAEIERRREAWEQRGLSVGTLTWRDQARQWPDLIVESRLDAVDPDSVKVVLERGRAVAEVVLYRGGWADVEWANYAGPDGDHHPEKTHDDLTPQTFGEVLDSLVDSLVASGDRWPAPPSQSAE
jgi:hypothetical protein